MSIVPISVIILTYNAESELDICLQSLANWADEVFVVDSYSDDRTIEIARSYMSEVVQHEFTTFAQQRQWALQSLPVSHEWVLFVDQDEHLTPELRDEIEGVVVRERPGIVAYYIPWQQVFLGRGLKHGGYGGSDPRLFRRNSVKLVEVGVGYYAIDGATARLNGTLIHEISRGKGLTWWIAKHNKYSDMEAKDLEKRVGEKKLLQADPSGNVESLQRRRMREMIINNLPLFIRPWILFCYRYFVRLGFLDGIPGFIYCFLHDFWYPFLIDAKVYELKTREQLGDGDTFPDRCKMQLGART